MPTGALVAAPTTSLPETPGGERNWDYRYCWMRDATFTLWGLHALGPRLGGRRLHAVRRRPGAQRGRLAADHVRDQGREGPQGADARPPQGLRGRAPGARSATAPTTSARTTSTAPCSTRSTCTPSSRDHIPERLWPVLRDQVECAARVWREPDQGIWEARGEPRHYVSSKLMCWVALDRGARLAERRGRERAGGAVAGRRRRDPRRTSSSAASTAAACSASTTTPTRSTPRTCSCRSCASCRPTTSACARPCWRSARSSPRTASSCATAPTATDDGLTGEEGTFLICSFWLVSALLGDRRAPRGRAPVRAAALLRLAARTLRRGARGLVGPPPRQLPAGLHPPGADQRRHARDRGPAAAA